MDINKRTRGRGLGWAEHNTSRPQHTVRTSWSCSHPFFLINVAFNRKRGGIKEMEGRLCCYQLHIQLYRRENRDPAIRFVHEINNLFIFP